MSVILKTKSKKHQINTLIYITGGKTNDIVCLFGLIEDEKVCQS